MTVIDPGDVDPTDAGGVALAVGAVLILLVLFRRPGAAVEAAAAGPGAAAFLVVLPVGSLVAGLYALRGGPHAGAGLFAFGSYLELVGLSTVLGNALAAGGSLVLLVAGVAVVALAVVTLVASALRLARAVQFTATTD